MSGTSNFCSIGFRDDRSPPYWPHLNAYRRGDISLGRQIASPLDSMRSPLACSFPRYIARVSSLYRDRRQLQSLRFSPRRFSAVARVRGARFRHMRNMRKCKGAICARPQSSRSPSSSKSFIYPEITITAPNIVRRLKSVTRKERKKERDGNMAIERRKD